MSASGALARVTASLATGFALALAPFVIAGLAVLGTATTAGAQGAPLLTLADSTLFPEGISRDAAGGRWIISSIRKRTIVAVDDAGGITPFARDLPADIGAIFGIRVDAARSVLWATSAAVPQMRDYAPADTMRAELLELSLADGRLRRRIALPAAPVQRIPGDLALGRDGTLYVSDAKAARLYVVAPDSGNVRVITSPFMHSLQGLVLTRSGDAVIAADYRHGLIRIPLSGTDTVTRITTANGDRVQGLDGLAWHGDALIATHNGTAPGHVVRITLTPDQRRIADFAVLETLAGPGEPTLGEVVGDAFVFIANSPWGAFDETGARIPGVRLAPPEIRRLPLASVAAPAPPAAAPATIRAAAPVAAPPAPRSEPPASPR